MNTDVNTLLSSPKTLGQLLDDAVAVCPDNDAIIYVDADYRQTWREVAVNTDRIAKGLMALRVRKGEKIALWATNSPYWVELLFAAARIGAILLPVNPKYKIEELQTLLRHSKCETIAIIDGYLDYNYVAALYRLLPELRISARSTWSSAKFPELRRILFLGMEPHRGMYSLGDLVKLSSTVSDARYNERKQSVCPDDIVMMPYTSGVTGAPKGVMLTHANIGANGYWIGWHQRFAPCDRVCIPVPLFHCFGCVVGVMACVTHASTMVITENFNPLQVLAALDQERCTAIYGVPTMFLAILEHKLFPRFDFSNLRTGVMAGALCPEPLIRRVMERLHVPDLTVCYGMTEASVMTQTCPDDPISARTGTVGRGMPGIEVRCLDPQTGIEVPRNEPGEICCRGYNVMKGYYRMPEATAECIDNNGWLHSGDLGVMDEQGYVRVTGRIKDMIICGGENIYPKEIEDWILCVPDVLDVQAVGIPSRKYGEEICAFIIPAKDKMLFAEDIRYFLRDKIAAYKIPKHIALVQNFPLTDNGKVQKFRLREMAMELFAKVIKE